MSEFDTFILYITFGMVASHLVFHMLGMFK